MTEPRRVPVYQPQIEVAVAALRPWPENYQLHPDAQIDELVKSLQLGQYKNVVVYRPADDPDLAAGEYYILAGHGLVDAARRAGYTHIVAQDWSALSLDEARALLIADNETARLAQPDAARLLALVEQVRATGQPVPGVSAERVAEIRALAQREAPVEPGDAEPQIDKAAELQAVWQVQAGDLWRIGEHRLVCGDCTDPDVVARVMGGERAGAVVTDPPYAVGVGYASFDDTQSNVLELIGAFMHVTKDMRPMALTPGIPMMWDYPRPDWVMAWIHPAATSSGPWGFNGVNPILVYGDDPYLKHGLGLRHDNIVLAADREGVDGHPAPKPIKVWAWLVERMTIEHGAVIFDPFVGSGTTIVACQNLGRRCRAVELEPKYCAVALQRMQDAFPDLPIERVT